MTDKQEGEMGTYSVTVEELKERLQEFLENQDGEVYAENLIDAWNDLADENGWEDRLMLGRKKRGKKNDR